MGKKGIAIVISIFMVFLILFAVPVIKNITGNVVGGPSEADSACLKKCVVDEGKEESICMNECGVDPEPTNVNEDESCMQKCIKIGCDEYDTNCQNKNMNDCEDECGMKGDAPDESEMDAEQLCISNCVAKEDSTLICGNSQTGETGNELCQKCANECVHLYEGPCLNDEQLSEKEKECETCEHCYGEPVEGPSGEGWDCIVDVECKDASSEFGDEAGEGPGIGQEGYVAPNPIAGAVNSVMNFFKGIFSGGENTE